VPVDNGGYILFELPDGHDPGSHQGGTVPAGRGDGLARAGAAVTNAAEASLKQSLGAVTEFTKAVYKAVSEARPDEAEAEFGFDLGVDGGNALIVRGSVNCHVRVKLTWRAGNRDPGAHAEITPGPGSGGLSAAQYNTGNS
jgi:hypothetical protein